MSVSRRLRYEILRRDDHACRYCGAKAPDVPLTVDHVLPVALGGGDEASNLVAACRDCNAGKSASSPDAALVEQVSADAVRWAQAMEKAAAVQMAEKKKLDGALNAFSDAWGLWTIASESVPLPPNWPSSIRRFASLGLENWVIVELVNDTLSRSGIGADERFRYFCACCWNVMRDRQSIATDLIAQDEGTG